MKRLILAAAVAVGMSTTMPSHANTNNQPGNCAIWAEMTAETVAKDARLGGAEGKTIKASLEKYAAAQQALVDRDMEGAYEKAKAFGWDKAKVDAQMKAQSDAIRAGFRTSTMEPDTVYMDHVMAVYQCGERATTEAELGQPATEFASAMNTLANIVQGK